MPRKNKQTLTLIILVVLIIAMAAISFALRSSGDYEPEPVAEELTPKLVFTVGPLEVTSTVINTWIMIAVLGLGAFLIGRTFKVRPGMLQNAIEWLVEAIQGIIAQNIGSENSNLFFPVVSTLAIFIGVANLLGLIPGLQSPTPDINTPVAMALIVFFLVPYFGIRTQGLWGYLKHYVDPIFLMLPIEIASEIARTFSLTFRLFGNRRRNHHRDLIPDRTHYCACSHDALQYFHWGSAGLYLYIVIMCLHRRGCQSPSTNKILRRSNSWIGIHYRTIKFL